MVGRHHPFRWRPFTWFVADADALLLGFVVGILLGYGRLGPVGSNASEGFALLLLFAVAFAIVANVVLGVAWVVTGVITRRHRPEGQPIRRWVWLSVPAALIAGALVGGQLVTDWWSGERVVTAASVRTWERVPADAAVFGGDGMQAMNDVVLGGPGVVAVGYETLDDQNAAVWTSPDRIAWGRVSDGALGGTGPQEMNAVSIGGPGLVAVGSDGSQGDDDAAAWTSPDGVTWSRVPHVEAVLGGAGNQVMNDVTQAGIGLVAVGYDGVEGAEHAAMWTSTDGVSWSRVPDDGSVFGGEQVFMTSVDAGGPWVVAVGYTYVWERGDPAPIWISRDGAEWSRLDDDRGLFGGARLYDVLVGGAASIVAIGQTGDDAAVWIAPIDDIAWSRVPHDEASFGGEAKQMIESVISANGLLVAGGGRSWPTSPRAALWTSVDGTVWSPVGETPSLTGGLINAVAGDGRGLVAVGFAVGENGEPDAAVWVPASSA